MKKFTVFLDRDGTIIEYPSHEPLYNFKPEHLHFIPNSIKAIKALNDKNVNVIVITNQSGISKNLYTMDDCNKFDNLMISELQRDGASIDRVYICPHTSDDGCACRKPKTELFKKAKIDFDIDFGHSYMIGDSVSDMEAGKSIGCKTIMVMSGVGKREYDLYSQYIKKNNLVDFTSYNLFNAVEYISFD